MRPIEKKTKVFFVPLPVRKIDSLSHGYALVLSMIRLNHAIPW
jgi:hypothetical protein